MAFLAPLAGFIARSVATSLIGQGVESLVNKAQGDQGIKAARGKATDKTAFDAGLKDIFTRFAGGDGMLNKKEFDDLSKALKAQVSKI